ncbi:hypothetical protein B0F86_06990 [Pseudomonas syringae]|nr:hypothetical protein B0F86_06990 [Pseudomonas syringae]RXT67631.1 hypothetical protein B1F74_03395 [Pseudomonas syringae]
MSDEQAVAVRQLGFREPKAQLAREFGISREALYQYLSLLGWEHINLTGDYVWRQSRKLEDGKFRPLRQLGKP